MIKGITSNSPFVVVGNGMPSGPYISPGSAGAGMVRYNPNSNNLEVNDGSVWKEIAGAYASVDLSHDAQELLTWARRERDKQMAREAKIKTNPALQKAYEAIQRAQENFDLLEAIAGEYKPSEQESA